MMKKYLYGVELPENVIEKGCLNYSTIYKICDHPIMNNDIVSRLVHRGCDWVLFNGIDYDEEEGRDIEFPQYYIIDSTAAEILKKNTDETVYYCDELNMYVWAVAHWGTPWTDVWCTDWKI